MKSITGSILAGFGMLSLVMLKVNKDTAFSGFNLFDGITGTKFFGGTAFYPWVLITNILPLVAIIVGIILIIQGVKEKKQ